jgi:hypothetical protein
VALQDTLQVTPLPDVSPFTVAVKGAACVASTDVDAPETETAIWETVELLPPHPTMIVAEANATSVRAKDDIGFMCASKIGTECTT